MQNEPYDTSIFSKETINTLLKWAETDIYDFLSGRPKTFQGYGAKVGPKLKTKRNLFKD